MIRINRTAVDIPAALRQQSDSLWAEELERANELVNRDGSAYRFRFTAFNEQGVRDALWTLFRGKCAYCESRLRSHLDICIDQFRPEKKTETERGEILDFHYYWLAADWDNLFLACQHCTVAHTDTIDGAPVRIGKMNHFPIEGTRAQAGADPQELEAELPLLLNPTKDSPEQHLIFLKDGSVVAETRRGQTTIDLFGLNRDLLRANRRARISEGIHSVGYLASLCHSSQADPEQVARHASEIEQMLSAGSEFSAALRQILRPTLDELSSFFEINLSSLRQTPLVSDADRAHAKEMFDDYHLDQAAFSVNKAINQQASNKPSSESPDLLKYMQNFALIESVHVSNIRAIRDLYICLSPAASVSELDQTGNPASDLASHSHGSWIMLLGENATAKSTILQALAIALVGRDYLEDLILRGRVTPSKLLRKGAATAEITVCLAGRAGRFSRGVRFKAGSDTIEHLGSDEAQNLVLAYGATRLLSKEGSSFPNGRPWARVENLFDAFQPIERPDTWLASLANSRDERERIKWQRIRQLWADVIAPHANTSLDLDEKDHLVLIDQGTAIEIDELSAGFQAALALTTDVLRVAFSLHDDATKARGIILLDEIGAHLHPTWRMRIVSCLRDLLPEMQFIATTHEPLCLRGLRASETVLMKRRGNEIVALTQLPSPSSLRVDQLLTSKYFGLNSTIDPQLDDKFSEYYQLLAMSEEELKHSRKEGKLERLRNELAGEGVLGYTRRDQLLYEAIDRYLVGEQVTKPETTPGPEEDHEDEDSDLERRKEEMQLRVAQLWDYAKILERLDP